MSTSINVTACDNELYLIAFDSKSSYRVGQIQSGNHHTVDVTINLTEGTYVAPAVLNGVNSNLSTTITTSIPTGQYSLCLVGLNWGTDVAFAATVNGKAFTGPVSPANTLGVVWTPALVTVKV